MIRRYDSRGSLVWPFAAACVAAGVFLVLAVTFLALYVDKKNAETGATAGGLAAYLPESMASMVTPTHSREDYDYGVVGAGQAGTQFADDILGVQPTKTVVIIEAETEVGGNTRCHAVEAPTGYTGPPLKFGLGALRNNLLTMLRQRRNGNYYNITYDVHPHHNTIWARGRKLRCAHPVDKAIADDPADPYAYSDFCSYDERYWDPAYAGSPLGPAYVDLGVVAQSPGADPGFEGIYYLIGYTNVNPYTNVSCTTVPGSCPAEACRTASSWGALVRDQLGPEYAAWMTVLEGVGFHGDYNDALDACAYIAFFTRTFDEASINAYPRGCMQEMPLRAAAAAQAKGAKLYLGESVLAVVEVDSTLQSRYATAQRNVGGSREDPPRFWMLTSKRLLGIYDGVVLAASPTDLVNEHRVVGNVMDELATHAEFAAPAPTSVAVINVQWDPNAAAPWYVDELDMADGHRSYTPRHWGDQGCTSRIEFPDWSYMRGMHMARIYSDYLCLDMWKQLIARHEAGDSAPLKARARLEIQLLFPNTTVPAIRNVYAKYWTHAWHSIKPRLGRDNMTVDDVSTWATTPLGAAKRVCIAGEAYNSLYLGWVEGALDLAERCVKRFAGNTATVQTFYATRAAILSDDDQYLLPSPLANENFWTEITASMSSATRFSENRTLEGGKTPKELFPPRARRRRPVVRPPPEGTPSAAPTPAPTPVPTPTSSGSNETVTASPEPVSNNATVVTPTTA